MYPQHELPSVGFTEALAAVLTKPRPESVWRLRRIMLGLGLQPGDPLWQTLAEFYAYINDVTARATARHYSEFAAQLDMAAIGGVAIQNLVHEGQTEGWLSRLILALASEGLMVAAARQYIKAWNEEMRATHRAAAWSLFEAYWKLSAELQPRLQPMARTSMVEKLVDPLRDEADEKMFKAGLGVRLFQILLLAQLEQAGWLDRSGPEPGAQPGHE